MDHKTIMLIEDDFDTQFLFTECLRAEDYEVVPMDHGKKALEYIEANGVPDLILMDLNTPFLTPEEFVERLRVLPNADKTHLIIVSGKSDIDEYAKKLRADDYIKKPFDLDPLLEKITRTIQ